jgi:oligoribonuclease
MERLLWIDCEMTGLDVKKEVIIEIAAIVTDLQLQTLDTYEAVINQPKTYLDNMDDWNKKHHGDSGLLSKIPFGKTPSQVEEELLALLKKHWPRSERPEKKDDLVVLCGNSVMQDRLFLEKTFSIFMSKLHYRQLDVTSWKIIFNEKFGKKYDKKNSHRALEDIKESIEELKYYLSFVNPR